MCIRDRLRHLADVTKKLVIYDIVNQVSHGGESVSSNNCSRFLRAKSSPELCVDKIKNHLESLDLNVSTRKSNKISRTINQFGRTEYDVIRGHFLFSAALKYVTTYVAKRGKKIAVSNEALFGALIIAFETVFSVEHEQYDYYKQSFDDISINA